jgi:3'-phosphoadenosine 5'-phosphosulfate sulfotransferase (PAPS reductase)/FAD synthetase
MANKHQPYDLAQMQSLPLEVKIIMTQQRIRQWYEHWDGMVYVSFSGGKDSTVLKHIVDGMYDDVPALFVNTGLEYPEIQKFAMSQPNVVTVRPEMRFDEVIKQHGFPIVSKEVANTVYGARHGGVTGKWKNTRLQRLRGEYFDKDGNKSAYNCEKWGFLLDAPFEISDKCCKVMKKTPARKYAKETGRKQIVGTMASESRLRKQKWLQHGCNAFDSTVPSSQPLSFWTEQDILQYIKKYDVPYCSVYGDIVPTDKTDQVEGQLTTFDILDEYEGTQLKTTGCNRTGCVFCLFGIHLESEPNRMQRLKETHPRQYEYCIGGGEMVDGKWQPNKEGLGLGKVLDYIGVDY